MVLHPHQSGSVVGAIGHVEDDNYSLWLITLENIVLAVQSFIRQARLAEVVNDGEIRSSRLLTFAPHYIHYTRNMETESAIRALGALAQATRLDTFRLLVRSEPTGLPAGVVARELEVPQNTMSAHLAILARAGLVRSERRSRSIIYRADIDCLRELMTFLAKDCCAGSADLCAPLIADLAPCC